MNPQPAFCALLPSTCRRTLWLCLSLGALTACATLPKQPTERAYYVDVRKALHAEARLGWTVDRVEIAEAAVQAEPSACRVSPAHRAALRSWVALHIAAAGGPAEQQFKAGVEVDDLDPVIDLERTRALLDDVELHVPADCPAWVKPSERFYGLHSTAHRFILIAESMGGGSLSLVHRQVQAGGGGAARVFAGYGFSTHWMAAAGLEAGGDATLQKEHDMAGALAPQGAFRFAVPAILRLTDIDRIYDLELAAVTRLANQQLKPWGARIAIAGGIAGLRRIGLMPSLQILLGYEIYPAQSGLSAEHVIRFGTRVGVDWHP